MCDQTMEVFHLLPVRKALLHFLQGQCSLSPIQLLSHLGLSSPSSSWMQLQALISLRVQARPGKAVLSIFFLSSLSSQINTPFFVVVVNKFWLCIPLAGLRLTDIPLPLPPDLGVSLCLDNTYSNRLTYQLYSEDPQITSSSWIQSLLRTRFRSNWLWILQTANSSHTHTYTHAHRQFWLPVLPSVSICGIILLSISQYISWKPRNHQSYLSLPQSVSSLSANHTETTP